MKVEINIDDVDILEAYEDYANEYKPEAHRRWGRMSWLYPGDIIAQISGKSANAIMREIADQIRKNYEDKNRK